jgi:hypothetical protein
MSSIQWCNQIFHSPTYDFWDHKFWGYTKNLKIIICAMENLSIPLDKARRVVLGTTVGVLEHVSGRIAVGITRIGS